MIEAVSRPLTLLILHFKPFCFLKNCNILDEFSFELKEFDYKWFETGEGRNKEEEGALCGKGYIYQ